MSGSHLSGGSRDATSGRTRHGGGRSLPNSIEHTRRGAAGREPVRAWCIGVGFVGFLFLLAACGPGDSVAPPAPGFELEVTDDPVEVTAGGEAGSLTVSLTRDRAFGADVTLTAEELPSGVSSEPSITAAQDEVGTLTLRAAADAVPGGPFQARIVGDADGHGASDAFALVVKAATSSDPSDGDGTSDGPGPAEGPGGELLRTYPLGATSSVRDVEPLSDGSTLLAAVTEDPGAAGGPHALALLRVDRRGDPDPAFGDGADGVVREPLGGAVQALDMRVLAGWLVTALVVEDGAGGIELALMRHDATGGRDAGYGGVAAMAPGITATDATVASDGRVYVVGYGDDPDFPDGDPDGMDDDFVVARFDATGSADGTFAGDGVQYPDLGPADRAYDLALLERRRSTSSQAAPPPPTEPLCRGIRSCWPAPRAMRAAKPTSP